MAQENIMRFWNKGFEPGSKKAPLSIQAGVWKKKASPAENVLGVLVDSKLDMSQSALKDQEANHILDCNQKRWAYDEQIKGVNLAPPLCAAEILTATLNWIHLYIDYNFRALEILLSGTTNTSSHWIFIIFFTVVKIKL